MRLLLCFSAVCISCAHANVTLYGPKNPQAIFRGSAPAAQTASAPSATFTGVAAYNPTVLTPPSIPSPPPPTAFNINLATGAVNGLSMPQSGAFIGFSIEMSIVNQVCECVISPLNLR